MATMLLRRLVVLVLFGTLIEETCGLMGRLSLTQNLGRNARRKIPKKKPVDVVEEAKKTFAQAEKKVSFNLAPSYGTLDARSLQELDKSLKTMIGGILELDLEKEMTWKQLITILDACPLMTKKTESYAYKLERLSFTSLRFFGLGSDKTEIRKKKIETWFTTLVGNVDIIKDTSIDLASLSKMVSNITVDMIHNLWTIRNKKSTLLDLGILRFPDISTPFFSVYRINLMAKCNYQTYILHQTEKSDIIGLFEREVYYPNKDYIESLSGDLTSQLLSEVDDLFSDF